jgi:hypothetical protein
MDDGWRLRYFNYLYAFGPEIVFLYILEDKAKVLY